MPMTALERKAAYVAASILKEHTLEQAAAEVGAHPNHIYLVLAGKRTASQDLEERLARYAGRTAEEFALAPAPAVAV
jgi:hypothetical protein